MTIHEDDLPDAEKYVPQVVTMDAVELRDQKIEALGRDVAVLRQQVVELARQATDQRRRMNELCSWLGLDLPGDRDEPRS